MADKFFISRQEVDFRVGRHRFLARFSRSSNGSKTSVSWSGCREELIVQPGSIGMRRFDNRKLRYRIDIERQAKGQYRAVLTSGAKRNISEGSQVSVARDLKRLIAGSGQRRRPDPAAAALRRARKNPSLSLRIIIDYDPEDCDLYCALCDAGILPAINCTLCANCKGLFG